VKAGGTLTAWGLDTDRGGHWDQRAACANPDYDPVWWDVPAPTDILDRYAATDRAGGALKVCAGCPVRRQCAADAERDRPQGVIRAGVIHGDHGEVLTLDDLRRRRISKPPKSDVQPCGTVTAESRHRYHREEPCEACKEARRRYDRARYVRAPRRTRDIA
jgi:hypothetical protein